MRRTRTSRPGRDCMRPSGWTTIAWTRTNANAATGISQRWSPVAAVATHAMSRPVISRTNMPRWKRDLMAMMCSPPVTKRANARGISRRYEGRRSRPGRQTARTRQAAQSVADRSRSRAVIGAPSP